MLFRVLIDIPFKLFMIISLPLLKYFKEEVETNPAFTALFCILMASKLHNFKVEIFRLWLKIQDFDFRLTVSFMRLEWLWVKLSYWLVKFRDFLLILLVIFFQDPLDVFFLVIKSIFNQFFISIFIFCECCLTFQQI